MACGQKMHAVRHTSSHPNLPCSRSGFFNLLKSSDPTETKLVGACGEIYKDWGEVNLPLPQRYLIMPSCKDLLHARDGMLMETKTRDCV